MKTCIVSKGVFFLLLVVCSSLSSCSLAGIPAHPDKIAVPRVELKVVKPEVWQLENGLRVFYMHDDELPLMTGSLLVRGGSLWEESGEEGIAGVTGKQLREGSVPGLSPDRLDELLDSMGASIESSFGEETGSVSFSCLTDDIEQIFSLFTDVALRPSFDPKRLALTKHLAIQAIARRKDSPGTIAGMTFAQALYGPKSSYQRSASKQSISKISPASMRDFYRRFFDPRGAILAASGSLKKEEFAKLVSKSFGDWGHSETWSDLEPPEVGDQIRPGVYVVKREFEQARIIVGHRGPPRLPASYYELQAFNRLFGSGGFSSTLFQEIRSRLGLAYSVYGGFYPGPKVGVFQIDAATRAEQAEVTVAKIIELLEQVRQEPYPKDDLERALNSAERSFVFRFAGPSAIVSRTATHSIHGYPDDFDELFIPRLREVSVEDVMRFAKDEIDISSLVVVMVGNVNIDRVRRALGGKLPIYRVAFDEEPRVLGEISVSSN